jgi:hypothetical protein
MASTTKYSFAVITGTGNSSITSSDSSYHKNVPGNSVNISVDYTASQVIIEFLNKPTKSLSLSVSQVLNINGTPFSGTLDQLADALSTTVFIKAASGGSVSPGAWYLRGDAVTANSVRIIISGTNVNLQNTTDGVTWNDVVTIGGPV